MFTIRAQPTGQRSQSTRKNDAPPVDVDWAFASQQTEVHSDVKSPQANTHPLPQMNSTLPQSSMAPNTRTIQPKAQSLYSAALAENAELLRHHRVGLAQALIQKKQMKQTEFYGPTAREILELDRTNGVPMSVLNEAISDKKKLDTVLDQLRSEKQITEQEDGKTMIVRLIA